MSEPITSAKEAVRLTSEIFHWSIRDERIKFRSDAYAVGDGTKAVLIDPLPLEDAAMKALGKVEAICLTRPCHQRSAWRLRKELGARVYAPQGARELEEAPDAAYGPGEALPGGLHAVHTPGPDATSYAFHRPAGMGALFCGDLLVHDGKTVSLLPGKYMADPRQGRESALKLASLRYAILLFDHGPPLVAGPQDAIREAVEASRKSA